MDDAKKDLYWFLGFLVILALLWYVSGGPKKPESNSGLFLNKPQENYTQQVQNEVGGNAPAGSNSNTDNNVNFQTNLTASNVRESDPGKEYVEIYISSNNNQPIDITGWSLVGKRGQEAKIGQGTLLPYPGQVNSQQDILVRNGDRIIVTTGQSPVGISFRLNKCTGYFNQFQTFYPYLPQECPSPGDESVPNFFNDQCLLYLEQLSRCQMQISIPPGLQPECQNFVNEKINYSYCSGEYKNSLDFYKNEWRVYLNRNEELWSNLHDTIILQDQNKRLLDWVTY